MTEPQKKKERSKESVVAINHLGRQWLKALLAILKATKTHESNNDIFTKPIDTLVQAEQEVVRLDEEFVIRLLGDQFFVNGVWIKPVIVERRQIFQAVDLFKDHGLGSVTLSGQNSRESWVGFLRAYKLTLSAPKTTWVQAMIDGMLQEKVVGIALEPIRALKDDREIDLPLPAPVLSMTLSYAKCLVGVKEFVSSSSTDERITALRKLQRSVCDLIELCIQLPRLSMLMPLLKDTSNYYAHHGANTATLSILLGRKIGMHRSDLADLAVAALLQDVGMHQLPENLLQKSSPLLPEEWALIRTHPIRSSEALLDLGYINRSVILRALSVYSHHWSTAPEYRYPKPRRDLPRTLISEILGITLRYDALTSERPYQGLFEPFEAMRLILIENEEKHLFRKDLAFAFYDMVGLVPVGSWLEFPDGASGIVAVSGQFSPTRGIPWVFIPSTKEWREAKGPLKARRKKTLGWSENVGVIFKNAEGSLLLQAAS